MNACSVSPVKSLRRGCSGLAYHMTRPLLRFVAAVCHTGPFDSVRVDGVQVLIADLDPSIGGKQQQLAGQLGSPGAGAARPLVVLLAPGDIEEHDVLRRRTEGDRDWLRHASSLRPDCKAVQD